MAFGVSAWASRRLVSTVKVIKINIRYIGMNFKKSGELPRGSDETNLSYGPRERRYVITDVIKHNCSYRAYFGNYNKYVKQEPYFPSEFHSTNRHPTLIRYLENVTQIRVSLFSSVYNRSPYFLKVYEYYYLRMMFVSTSKTVTSDGTTWKGKPCTSKQRARGTQKLDYIWRQLLVFYRVWQHGTLTLDRITYTLTEYVFILDTYNLYVLNFINKDMLNIYVHWA